VNSTVTTIDFFKGTTGYNKLYSSDGSVLVYDDRIVLEYLSNAKKGTWKQIGVPQSINYSQIDDYTYEVDRYYDNFLGTSYVVKYLLKSVVGETSIKTTIEITSGQTDIYRLNWSPSGITNIDSVSSTNSTTFVKEKGSISFDWSDVYQNFGNITSSSISTVAQGGKLSTYFNIGSLVAGQKIVVDPITRVQGNNSGTSGTSSVSVTMSSTPVSGNILIATIAIMCWTSTAITVSSITETNVVWTKVINSADTDESYYWDSEIWKGVVSASASTSVTVTLSGTPGGGGGSVVNICEYNSSIGTLTTDKTAYNSGADYDIDSGTTVTTTESEELWIGSLMGTGAQATPTNSFTLLDGTLRAHGGSGGFLEKIVSSTGTANVGDSQSPTWYYWSGCIATFKAVPATVTETVVLSNSVSISTSSSDYKIVYFKGTTTTIISMVDNKIKSVFTINSLTTAITGTNLMIKKLQSSLSSTIIIASTTGVIKSVYSNNQLVVQSVAVGTLLKTLTTINNLTIVITDSEGTVKRTYSVNYGTAVVSSEIGITKNVIQLEEILISSSTISSSALLSAYKIISFSGSTTTIVSISNGEVKGVSVTNIISSQIVSEISLIKKLSLNSQATIIIMDNEGNIKNVYMNQTLISGVVANVNSLKTILSLTTLTIIVTDNEGVIKRIFTVNYNTISSLSEIGIDKEIAILETELISSNTISSTAILSTYKVISITNNLATIISIENGQVKGVTVTSSITPQIISECKIIKNLNISYQTTVVVLYENGTIKNLYLSNTLSTEVISSETSLKELFLTDSIVIIVTDENGVVKRIYMNSLNTIKITSSGWTSVVVVIAGITFDIPWLVIFLVIGIVFGLMFAILYCKRNKGDKQNVV
jgi:hypothetical protein